MEEEEWVIIAKRIGRKLRKTHRLELDKNKKEARVYRTCRFEHGLLPTEEEIIVTDGKVIVKKVGFDEYRLKGATEKVLYELGIGCLINETEERIKYIWKTKVGKLDE